jgi:alcohol dehydrogenase class IV
MVNSFQFSGVPKIIFRNGSISSLPGLAKGIGKNILLVTGKSSFFKSSACETLLTKFSETGLKVSTLQISGEPSPGDIDSAVKLYRNSNIDLVIGIGGGSALDAGKAISAMLKVPDSIVNYLEGIGTREHPGIKIPFIAVPTTSGTGSEATKNSVISEIGQDGFKKSLRHDNLVPDIALIDPELTIRCPREITAASGMDCFTQLTEAYLSDKSSVYTDSLALAGIIEIKNSLLQSYLHGDDIGARSGMSFAALTSGICIANAGLGVVHGFASSIGGMFNIPHGVVCGTLMAVSNEINVRDLRKNLPHSPALPKYTKLGKLFLGDEGKSTDYYIDFFIDYLKKLTEDLNLPNLKSLGITDESVEEICRRTENKNNPIKFQQVELIEILKGRL